MIKINNTEKWLLKVVRHNKHKKPKLFKKMLVAFLNSAWKSSCDPSLKEVVIELRVLDNESKDMLKKMLRQLRVVKMLDTYYDQFGTYRICEFK